MLCEDHKIPYVFVPSKAELGAAGGTKRPTSCVLVPPHSDYESDYLKARSEVEGACGQGFVRWPSLARQRCLRWLHGLRLACA